MFRLFYRKQYPIGTIHFCFLRSPLLKFISQITKPTEKSSFTVSYLVNSCGLSPQAAICASKKINMKTTERADSVLTFFKNIGFSETHISRLITRIPLLLFACPEETLKPKIDLFHSIGISGPMLGKILCANPSLLRRSLKNQLQPSLEFLKGFVGTTDVVDALRRSTQVLQSNPEKILIPKIQILRNHGVPEHRIVKLIILHPRVFSLRADRFSKVVTTIKEMGFNPISSVFILGVRAMSVMSISTWERKWTVFRSIGWSEDEIYLAFKKQPLCMIVSEEKIMKVMYFFVNKLCCKPGSVSRCPNLLMLSLENRILPRCWVIRTLISKNLIKNDVTVAWVLIMTEKNFLEKFVIKYENEFPELLNAYQSKMGSVGLDLESEQLDELKLL